MRCLASFVLICSLLHAVSVSERVTSYPYISGDTFRAFADHIIDETGMPFSLESVKQGDIIFVKTDYLAYFFSAIHPCIEHPYILLTHNSDYSVPGPFSHYLNDPKLFAWFGQNIDRMHPKLHPIPIGLANHYWPHGKEEVVKAMQEQRPPKDILLYINYANTTAARVNKTLEQLTRLPGAYVPARKPFAEYVIDLARSIFVVSPPGNGIDCHRTWESLYLGATPIVKRTEISALYDDLPVLVVDDWDEITEKRLLYLSHEYQEGTYNLKKLYADYWFSVMHASQEECRRIN